MNWIEVKLTVDGEAAEAVAELLRRYGHQGISIEQDGIHPDVWDETEVPAADKLTVRAYLPDDADLDTAKRQLETALGHMSLMYPMPEPTYARVQDEDWANTWKAHYQPVRLGQRILIRPLWQDVETRDDDIEIALDPGMAFGTGTHPTTQLCLVTLEAVMRHGVRVLDLGSGSGILSIAAAKLGAQSVLGLDIDATAVTSSQENIERNGVSDKVTIQQGSLETVLHSSRRFDLIVINILARIIMQMCADGLGNVVRPGGKAVFSGVLDTQVEDVENAVRNTGLTPYKRHQQGDWVAIEAYRPEDA
jgi:ribosomal protein L11 methyltransferase